MLRVTWIGTIRILVVDKPPFILSIVILIIIIAFSCTIYSIISNTSRTDLKFLLGLGATILVNHVSIIGRVMGLSLSLGLGHKGCLMV